MGPLGLGRLPRRRTRCGAAPHCPPCLGPCPCLCPCRELHGHMRSHCPVCRGSAGLDAGGREELGSGAAKSPRKWRRGTGCCPWLRAAGGGEGTPAGTPAAHSGDSSQPARGSTCAEASVSVSGQWAGQPGEHRWQALCPVEPGGRRPPCRAHHAGVGCQPAACPLYRVQAPGSPCRHPLSARRGGLCRVPELQAWVA